MDRYPLAQWLGNGTEYGPLPDKGYGREDVRLVLHTTETRGLPSYSGGDTAPHYTYDPAADIWWGHADLDRRVGTDKSAGNPVSIAVEILAYSDRNAAASVDGLWVGDFTPEQYQAIADFGIWLQTGPWPELDLGNIVYGPTGDFASWVYGSSAVTRMSWEEWDHFGGGLTAHGASPSGSTHWDTGELDLYLISAMIADGLEPEPITTTLIEVGDSGAIVQYWATILSFHPGTEIDQEHRVYDQAMVDAVHTVLPNAGGNKITGRQGAIITKRSLC